MFDFKGKVVVITGGETGIGRATVEAFARAGGDVVIAGYLEDKGQDVVSSLASEGITVEFVKTDVQQESSINSVIAHVLSKHGRIDVLVNNASVFDGFAGVLDTSNELWEKVINTNLRGTFYFCRAVLKDMVARGEGRIINVASVGGILGGADGLAYTTSKFGVIGLTRQMAVELTKTGVVINSVCPGMIQTDMRGNSARILGDTAPDMARGVGVNPDALKRVPAGKKGAPLDIANAIMFAASPYAGYMAGHSLVIDGGWTIQ
ncbi:MULTISPECIES: SDR family NAD(P)-dependent oxidoreductase [Rhizobium]|uniref:Short-chain dehydrogenase/reductase SDR n=2 Tax=Rhizobium TaxID=379 RepID=K0Q6J9_9HYPH|nr:MULTISPECIES: SDR family NAD(P)-dependent oxidoreductase [Rhizobium]KWV43461.1 short-chain dehydrogenase [Rhizobium altiplani]CCM79989.1 Short-chain dehydrogenase/reductase SDR [Rhizobium mesoamericanum STM3625]